MVITIISIISFFNLSKIIGLEKAAQQEQVGEMAFGASFVPGSFRIIDTEADKSRPELPYRVYRVKYLTFKKDTIGGDGLPQYEVIDRHYKEELFGAKGRFNWPDSLPAKFDDVLEVFGPVTFIGVQ